jgi:HSP20 family molecular chaperone IbpA
MQVTQSSNSEVSSYHLVGPLRKARKNTFRTGPSRRATSASEVVILTVDGHQGPGMVMLLDGDATGRERSIAKDLAAGSYALRIRSSVYLVTSRGVSVEAVDAERSAAVEAQRSVELTGLPPSYLQPSVDVRYTPRGLVAYVDLPCVPRGGLALEVREGRLWIQGARAPRDVGRGPGDRSITRPQGVYRCGLKLVPGPTDSWTPCATDLARVRYSLRNGVLRVTVPCETPQEAAAPSDSAARGPCGTGARV